MQIKQLSSGVEGCFVKTNKFKTSRISVNMYIDADEFDATAYSLLSMILVSETVDYPDYLSLNAYLKQMYSATFTSDVLKLGDMRVVRFIISFLDDKYTLENENVSEKAIELLLSACFSPPLENGLFKTESFENQKRVLIEQIEGNINEKRTYAIISTEKEMYKNENAGVYRYGSVDVAKKLQNKDLVLAHKKLLENSFVRVNVIGPSEPDSIYEKIDSCFSKLNRNVKKHNSTVPHVFSGEKREIFEQMDVTQGKLCMGFVFDELTSRMDKAKAAVCVDLFGGGPYSKLFTNVREKQSLCYYCAARGNLPKNSFMVDCGVLQENKQKAYLGILEQLELIKSGEVTDEELLASKTAICDQLNSVKDMLGSIDSWYASTVFYENEKLDDYIGYINSVTKQDVIDMANKISLDIVFFLGSNKE